MVQSPSWEANWFVASQEIPRISRNPKVHYRTHKRPPPVSILGQPKPFTFTVCICQSVAVWSQSCRCKQFFFHKCPHYHSIYFLFILVSFFNLCNACFMLLVHRTCCLQLQINWALLDIIFCVYWVRKEATIFKLPLCLISASSFIYPLVFVHSSQHFQTA